MSSSVTDLDKHRALYRKHKPVPGETDENGVCFICSGVFPKTLWCSRCSLEWTGEP